MKSESYDLLKLAKRDEGFTLIELIMAVTILIILAMMATPIYRHTIVRNKEIELRRDLREMRTAIDNYKDLADKNLIRSAVGSNGYPPDLDALVNGSNFGAAYQKLRFLRRIPVDPMTGHAEWTLQSLQDDPDSHSWGGGNVFDVHSKSQTIGLDGTPYSTW